MAFFTPSDRKILEELAHRKLELATNKRNEELMRAWNALGRGERTSPTVRLLFCNFRNEVIYSRMRCEGAEARRIEENLLNAMVGRELFDDDTPLAPVYEVGTHAWVRPFGAEPKRTRIPGSIGFHIEPITDDLEEDIDLFRGGSFGIDKEGFRKECELADDAVGKILPVKPSMFNLTPAMTNPLVGLIGMENFMFAMKDTPEALKEIMNMACTVYENYFDMLEKEGALLPTVGTSGISQESFAFTDELPTENVTSTKQVWGFMESQETTAVSPDYYGEFVYPYMDRLAKRFGLLTYGCCERLDNLFEKYLSKWTNLRKLSVSPFNDTAKVGEFLRGKRIVYYFKPRAEHVTAPGPLDEELIRRYFKNAADEASGCLFEVAQREVGSIYGDFERGKRYVQLAKESIDKYWKP